MIDGATYVRGEPGNLWEVALAHPHAWAIVADDTGYWVLEHDDWGIDPRDDPHPDHIEVSTMRE